MNVSFHGNETFQEWIASDGDTTYVVAHGATWRAFVGVSNNVSKKRGSWWRDVVADFPEHVRNAFVGEFWQWEQVTSVSAG